MKGIVKGVLLLGLISTALLAAGCSGKVAQKGEATKAIAVMNPTQGSMVHGTVTFKKEGGKVRIIANIEGLSPGPHGFHVHEFGDCTAVDASSAGGHFNPTNMPHGGPKSAKRHVGDLGNVIADKNGVARLDMTDNVIRLEGPNSIIGRSVIIHAHADDFKTQPTGNSGARVACGVIGIAK